ncbi:NAD+ synthase [Herpetosiphon giganteus]|uniref:NAD+ synthase n=1 Tax=Herpetosiphon giganteus TaxID=2029754 RepID=UPI0019591C76|nr:NAD+ synthase [Herpetosiphon giganteus]MBM7842286.1 NAD+ synthetase [Herpetosiphon giganteus]
MYTLALAQFRPRKGHYAANLARLGELFAQFGSNERRPDVLMLPETALTGYFLEGGVREQALTAGQLFHDLQQTYLAACGADAPALDIVVGFYERWRERFYNSALYATLGSDSNLAGIGHVHRKMFLPTYGVFDEARFVEAGREIAAFDTRFGRVAILICEDAWHSLSGTVAALDGAQMLYVVSASPARGSNEDRPSNLARWDDRIREIAGEHGVYLAVCQIVGFEGGKGFAGGSVVVGPRSDERARAPLWSEAVLLVDIDLSDLTLARADLPLLADLEERLPFILRDVNAASEGKKRQSSWDTALSSDSQGLSDASSHKHTIDSEGEKRAKATVGKQSFPIIAAPRFDPNSDEPLRINPELTLNWLIEFLRDEVGFRRGFKQVVIGLSGGVDSALTTYLCAKAFGPENVLAVRMPYRTSSSDSLDHAQLVIDDLGIQQRTIEITNAVDGYLAFEPDADGRRRGNVMARTRMIVLFDQSQKLGCIPIGTGNKTERLFGYYTWHADDAPPVNPLGDLFKTQVWELASAIGVPDVIVHKPASADLVVGQTDEDDFGISYRKADRVLAYLLSGYRPEQLVARGFNADEVAIVQRRVNTTHWKRHLPSTAMLSSTAIGEYYLRPVDY